MPVFIYPGELCEKNNAYLGAFRNDGTCPAELLNQFGGDSPVHRLGRSRDTGRGSWSQSTASHQGQNPTLGASRKMLIPRNDPIHGSGLSKGLTLG